MFVTIKIKAEVEYAETVESIKALLDNTLPYMADNVIVKTKVEE
jgi:hypothetical protein